jgi:hypothetical protein
MVLEDANTAADSFTDNPYPSESDTYANSSSPSGGYDPSTLPGALPILGPLLGFSDKQIRFRAESTLKFAAFRVHRPLTSEEAQALATHIHTLEQSKFNYSAGGLALGVIQWYRTMGANKYPFYKPKLESIDPNKFGFIKGPMAQYARHSWRFVLYAAIASRLGELLGQVVAQPVAAQNTARDPKLGQFTADMRAVVTAEHGNAQGVKEKLSKEIDSMREFSEKELSERRFRTPQRQPGNVRKPTPVDDDMSPTSYSDPEPSTSSDSWSTGGSSYDSVPKPQMRQRPSPPSDAWNRRPARPAEDDDASPTGGMFQDEVQSGSTSGGSTWERLRRGQAPPSGQQRPPPSTRAQPPQREGSTLGDSWTFAESDDERQRAQERAQREFDARLERERQGKDFTEERKW